MNDDVWENISDECLRKAESIGCSFRAFVEGLKTLELAIQERRQEAELELATYEAENPD